MKIGWQRARRAFIASAAAAAFGIAAWGVAPPARAESHGDPGTHAGAGTHAGGAVGDPRIDVARQHYQQGNAYYRLDKFHEALSEYEQAYIAKTDPSFLYNIAQCQRLMGNRAEALKYYKRFLKDQSNSPNAPVAEMHIRDLQALQDSQSASPPVTSPAPAVSVPMAAPVRPAPPTAAPPKPSAGAPPALAVAPDPAAVGGPPALTLASGPPVATARNESDDGGAPFYTRAWFWGGVGAVVVAGVVTALLLSSQDPCDNGRVCK